MKYKAFFRSLGEKIKESLSSVLPVAVIVLAIFFSQMVELTGKEVTVFLCSTFFLIVGIALFNLGADLAMTPMGGHVGSGLIKSKKMRLLLSVCFLMGVLITVAEPDLSVLASQAEAVINGLTLIVTIGLGVGIFLLLAVLKIIHNKDLAPIMLFFYMLIFALVALLIERGKAGMLPLSFDSGGVTTGPVTVPFIMALGVGIAGTVGGRNSKENSFGLVALCSIGPVLSMLFLSMLSKGKAEYSLPDYSLDSHLGKALFTEFLEEAKGVLGALFLILAFFLALNKKVLKLPGRRLVQIYVGIAYTFVGLAIFLTAVAVGYMPIGYKLGVELSDKGKTVSVIFAFVLGMVTVLAEPAIHVLNHQVEEVTDGNVGRKQMLIALSIGVGLSVGLSILRVYEGFSLLYYLVPGYILSLGLSFFVPKLYTAIAFDSGGVASGPLTSSFVLPMTIGVCVGIRGASAVMDFAFGIVAMVAMTPLIAIQVLGFRAIFAKRRREKAAMKRIFTADDAQIIYFDWEDKKNA
ncbi:MAG: DUF1538 domain-containing protein [Lachnospiraceae bacterium]|nr:DUF1538 domain-containing protein [Lachnospiraceae bacterium]